MSNIAEDIKSDKTMSIGNSSCIDAKALIDEPDGYVYTEQMKTEENGNKYSPKRSTLRESGAPQNG